MIGLVAGDMLFNEIQHCSGVAGTSVDTSPCIGSSGGIYSDFTQQPKINSADV
jgi:hypothetical protein